MNTYTLAKCLMGPILWFMKMVLKENWYTRTHNRWAMLWTMMIYAVVAGLSRLHFEYDLSATRQLVFEQGEWWRAFSAVFVHGDLAHFLANTPLFLLFTFLLIQTFGVWLPVLGLLAGGLMNFAVLLTMPPEVHLLGASGVVHWLGAMWLTLHLMIDRRDSLRVRFGSALFLVLMLFVPESYRPNVSYASHFFGFVLGGAMGWAYYLYHRAQFRRAERWEFIFEPEPDFDWMEGADKEV